MCDGVQAHMQAHSHTHAHAYAVHTHIRMHIHKQMHTCMHTQTHPYAPPPPKHTHAFVRAHAHAHKHADMQVGMNTYTGRSRHLRTPPRCSWKEQAVKDEAETFSAVKQIQSFHLPCHFPTTHHLTSNKAASEDVVRSAVHGSVVCCGAVQSQVQYSAV